LSPFVRTTIHRLPIRLPGFPARHLGSNSKLPIIALFSELAVLGSKKLQNQTWKNNDLTLRSFADHMQAAASLALAITASRGCYLACSELKVPK
jgi:hypothetical protein